jgi:uncharacterized protein (DUF433 family)
MAARVVVDPSVQHGKPVVASIRVPVARDLGGLAGGMSAAKIATEYGTTEDDVRVALDYARSLVDAQAYPLPAR